MSSPPFTPIRNYIGSIDTSPVQRQSFGHRRRSSSFSNHRSPVTSRSGYSDHRLSNASRFSSGINDLTIPLDGSGNHEAGGNGGGGGGNLADELEFADEDDAEWDDNGLDEGVSGMSLADKADKPWGGEGEGEDDDGNNDSTKHELDRHGHEQTQTDGARDSGVDVVYGSSPASLHQPPTPLRPTSKQQLLRNFSRPMSRESEAEAPPMVFSLEMEDAMTAISRLADPSTHRSTDTVSTALHALQHLSPQSALETNTQRLTTSTNSLSSHVTQQTRLLSSIYSSLFPPIGLATPLDPTTIDELLPQIAQVLQGLPLPDPAALPGLAKLDRETTDVLRSLAGLTDSLQMGKQATSMASRHLRNTLTMVTQLRREHDAAEQAKWKIEKEGWDGKLAQRWCAKECSDVVGGFEQVCEGLRQGLEDAVAA